MVIYVPQYGADMDVLDAPKVLTPIMLNQWIADLENDLLYFCVITCWEEL